MHKILGIIAVAVNFFAWVGTFDSARASAYRSRPKIAQVLKKQEAERLVEAKKSESTALVGAAPHQAPSVTDDKLLTDNSLLSGEVQADIQSREYHFTLDVRMWKTPADSIDPGKWKAQVLFFNMENLHIVSVFKADPIVQDGVITLNLEESDKSKAFFDYWASDLPMTMKKVVITIDANGTIRSGAEDDYGNKWKARVERLDSKSYDAMMGTWKGRLNDVQTKITLHEEGGQVIGDILYQHHIGKCAGKLKGVLRSGGQMILLGAPISDHTSCPGNYVLQLKTHENQLVGGYYDYRTREGAEEFKLAR